MLRVAAYCRVSTDKEDQANSFESQQRYFRNYISRNPDWKLVGIYPDEGISGTNIKKRKEFNRMLAAARTGKIDLIITKEVSRFARNTVDTLQYTRELKKLGVFVLFMNDNIHTRDPDAELRLTIMASIAQEESRKTSERVKWGQKRRMEQGVVFGRDMLGYDVRGGKLYINEEGAKTVRLIFHKFLEEGKGTFTIARELSEMGIETSTRKNNWTNTVILRILRNEKYCGDLIQKKTFTPDYLSHEKKYNRGEEEFVVLSNHHEPIVSREIFERTQRELERRRPSADQRKKHSNRYCLSGKIECGGCHSHFVSRTKKRRDGSQYRTWRCYEAVLHGLPKVDEMGRFVGCAVSQQIRDEDFMGMIQMTVTYLRHNRQKLIRELVEIIREVVDAEEGEALDNVKIERRIALIAKKREKLLDLYLGQEISQEEYRKMVERYSQEVKGLQKKQGECLPKTEEPGNWEEKFVDIQETVRALASGERQDPTFYRNIVDKIVVHSREQIEIHLTFLPCKWSFRLVR